MTKQEVIELIQGVRAGALVGLVLRDSVIYGVTAGAIRGKSYGFERNGKIEHAIKLDVIADALENEQERNIVLGNFGLLLKHAVVRNTYEAIQMYCEETNQQAKFKSWSAYDFARLVRNTLSHKDGAVLHRWSPPQLQQATWRHRTITPADVGKPLMLEPAEYFWLHEDMVDFLRNQLA